MKRWLVTTAQIVGGILAFIAFIAFYAFTHIEVDTTKAQPNTPDVIDVNQLLVDTNKDRADVNVTPLIINNDLTKSAVAKCNDMATKHYYSHELPDGSGWYTMLRQYIPYYTLASENIDANYDYETADTVNAKFMASPPHKQAIIDARYTDVGLASCKGEYNNKSTVFVVEQFMQK